MKKDANAEKIRTLYRDFGALAADFLELELMEEDNTIVARQLMRRAKHLVEQAGLADGLTKPDRYHLQKESLTIHELCRDYIPFATRPLRPELGFGKYRLVDYAPGDLSRSSYFRLEDDFRWWMHMGAQDIDTATELMGRAHNLFNLADDHRKNLTDLEYRWIRRGCFMIESMVSNFDGSQDRRRLAAFDKDWKGGR